MDSASGSPSWQPRPGPPHTRHSPAAQGGRGQTPGSHRSPASHVCDAAGKGQMLSNHLTTRRPLSPLPAPERASGETSPRRALVVPRNRRHHQPSAHSLRERSLVLSPPPAPANHGPLLVLSPDAPRPGWTSLRNARRSGSSRDRKAAAWVQVRATRSVGHVQRQRAGGRLPVPRMTGGGLGQSQPAGRP